MVFKKSYFDESWYAVNVGGSTLNLADRKLSTYLNALIEAGFAVEKLVEETDETLLDGSAFAQKARLLPVTFVFEARQKLRWMRMIFSEFYSRHRCSKPVF